jgi:hypothetical protein
MTEANVAPDNWQKSWMRGQGSFLDEGRKGLGGHPAAKLGEGKGNKGLGILSIFSFQVAGIPFYVKMGCLFIKILMLT